MFVIGGYSNNYCLDTIERLRKGATAWEILRVRLPIALAFPGVVHTGNYLLIIGGENNKHNSDRVFKWNTCEGMAEIEKLPEVFIAGSSDSVVYVDNTVFLIRSQNSGLPTIEKYYFSSS